MIASGFLRSPRRMTLLGLNMSLLGLTLILLLSPRHSPVPAPRAIDLSSLLADNMTPLTAKEISLADTYALMIGQPLFQPDRKYTAPPSVDTSVALSPAPDYVVTGYLDIPGRPPKAFLRERSGSRTVAVAMGDSLEGWTVVDLKIKQVSLRQGDRTADLMRSSAPIVSMRPATNAEPPGSTGQAPSIPPQPLPPTVTIPPASAVGAPQPKESTAVPGNRKADSARATSLPDPARPTVITSLVGVTVTARRIPLPAPLPAPLGPPRTFSSPATPDSN